MKKTLSSLTVLGFLILPTIESASAETRVIENPDELDEAGQEVLEDYEEPSVSEGTSRSEAAQIQASSRVVVERGSALAWSEGYVSWNYSGGSISASDAWQDSGYIFPNIVRQQGIQKTGTSSASAHEYRHKTTIGAGTVTPWGDVTVYEQGYTDYITVRGSGTYSVN